MNTAKMNVTRIGPRRYEARYRGHAYEVHCFAGVWHVSPTNAPADSWRTFWRTSCWAEKRECLEAIREVEDARAEGRCSVISTQRTAARDKTPRKLADNLALAFYSYEKAVEWIALNDEPSWLDVYAVQNMISVCLVADVTERDRHDVARDVVLLRLRWSKGGDA